MQRHILGIIVLAATLTPALDVAAACRKLTRPPIACTDGDPACDLDRRRDGTCILALCDTSDTDVPRLTFCAGSLRWTSLYRGPVGGGYVARAGTCPISRRRVSCRRPSTDVPIEPIDRTCIVGVVSAVVSTEPITTRCRIDAVRAERDDGRVGYRLTMRFPDAPFTADGLRGQISVIVRAPLGQGVFVSGDPERPIGAAVGNLGGQSVPIRVKTVRLQVDAMSNASTIWTDDIHGTLDVEQDGGAFDPRQLSLHVAF